jgi:hypothetical protein
MSETKENVFYLTCKLPIEEQPIFYHTLTSLIEEVNEDYDYNFDLDSLSEDEKWSLYETFNQDLQYEYNSRFYESTIELLDGFRKKN